MLLSQLEAALAQNTSLQFLVRHLQRLDIETYLAGGAMRDLALGTSPTDFDLVCRPHSTQHLLFALQSLNGKTDLASADLGIFLYHAGDGSSFEIALPRLGRPVSLAYSDFAIAFSPHLSIQDDLLRRDFNVNAIAYDFTRHIIVDPAHGLQSLYLGQFSALGSRSQHEDTVRVLRALVLCARHRLQPDAEAMTILQQASACLLDLPSHRVRRELLRVIAESSPDHGFRLARLLGALKILLPSLDTVYDFDQHNSHHHQSLGEHSLSVLALAAANSSDLALRTAALLHDIGKPACARWSKKQLYFPNHADVGAKLAQDALQHWDIEATLIDEVEHLITDHMFATPASWRQLGIKPSARRLLQLRIADEESKGKSVHIWQALLSRLENDDPGIDNREAFAVPTRHLSSRAHPWVEHRDRKQRGNWDERTRGKSKVDKPRRDDWS